MKAIAPTYTAQNQTFEVFEDGKYAVKGVEWFTTDDDDNPILVGQSDGKLVGRLNFILVDDKEGPPHSLTLAEMPLLVRAFGGDISKLPNKPDLSVPAQVSAYMKRIQELAIGTTSVEVKSGWVRNIAGAEIPTGLFYFKVVGVSPKNKETELPEPKDGQWGPWFLVDFEVVAGEGGSKTPWEGATFTEFISYAVEVKDGEPDWARNKKGDYTGAAVQLSHLMLYTAPGMFEDGFVFKNPNNILPDFLRMALKEKKILKGFRQKNKKGDRIVLDLSTVEPVTNMSTIDNRAITDNKTSEDAKARMLVKQLMNLVAGQECFTSDFVLNETGKSIAKKYISPLKADGKIKNGKIGLLTYDEILIIFNIIEPDVLGKEEYQPIKEKFSCIGMGLDDDTAEF